MAQFLIKPALMLIAGKTFRAIFHHQGKRFVASVELPPFAAGYPAAMNTCIRSAEEKALKALGQMLCAAVDNGSISFTRVRMDGGRDLLRERDRKESQA